jgi:hypothetical protein
MAGGAPHSDGVAGKILVGEEAHLYWPSAGANG